jgi:hypothetical protein
MKKNLVRWTEEFASELKAVNKMSAQLNFHSTK